MHPTIGAGTQWAFVMVTENLFRTGDPLELELPSSAQQELRDIWSKCLDIEFAEGSLSERCLRSTSPWDEYTRGLTPDQPSLLADYAADFTVQAQFRYLWRFIQTSLPAERRKKLLGWYHSAAEAYAVTL